MAQLFDVPETRARTLGRPRLAAQINAGGALTIVYGPAGSGKSTAVAHWAKSAERGDEPLIWATLRADDTGLSLWRRVACFAGLALDVPEIRELSGDAFPEVCRVLSEHAAPLTLVFDDYHHVSAPSLDARVRQLLEQCPTVRVVITTRTESTLHSLEAAARLGVTIVTAEALAFTPQETRALVDELEYYGDRDSLASQVYQATGGWPLASGALFAEATRRPGSLDSLLKAAAGASGFAMEFVQTTLRSRDPEEAEFLLRVSLADEFTVEMATAMSGRSSSDVEQLLGVAETQGIGTWQWRGNKRWFRFHPLLQVTFEGEAERQLPSEDVRWVRVYLSDEVVRSRPMRAFELAVRAEDWRRVESIFSINWFTLSFYFRDATSKWIAHIPREVAMGSPVLVGAKALRAFASPRAPIEELTQLFSLVKALKDEPLGDDMTGAFAELGRALVFRVYGDIATSLEKVERAHEILAVQPRPVKDAYAANMSMFHVQVGLTRLASEKSLEAVNDFHLAHQLISDRSRGGEIAQALGSLAMTRAWRGEMKLAAEITAQHEQEVPYDGWVGMYLQSGYHIAQILLAANAWDGAKALREYQSVADTEPVVEFWPYIAVAKSYADALVLGPPRAYVALRETVAQKRMRPPAPPAHRAMLTAMGAELLLLSGQPARAEQQLSTVEFETAATVRARARISLATGNPAAAMGYVDELLWQGEEDPMARLDALLVVAAAAQDSGDGEHAFEMFTAALNEIDHLGLRLPLLHVSPGRLVSLTELARSKGVPGLDFLADVPALGRASAAPAALSPAERRVLQAIRETGDVRAAAELLHLSIHTVRFHLKRLYRKLDVGTRQEAVTTAQTLGLI